MDLNEQIIQEAKTWLDVPYVHRGTTKRGCDCTGLVLGVLQNLGYKNYKLRKYPQDWNLHAMADDFIIEEIKKVSKRVPNSSAKPGDILVFCWGKCESHVGILLKSLLFIHSMAGSVCRISSLKRKAHFSRWTKTFRLNEIILESRHK